MPEKPNEQTTVGEIVRRERLGGGQAKHYQRQAACDRAAVIAGDL